MPKALLKARHLRQPVPDRLEVGGTGVRPLALGGAIHHCLRAQLSRIEGEEALTALLTRGFPTCSGGKSIVIVLEAIIPSPRRGRRS